VKISQIPGVKKLRFWGPVFRIGGQKVENLGSKKWRKKRGFWEVFEKKSEVLREKSGEKRGESHKFLGHDGTISPDMLIFLLLSQLNAGLSPCSHTTTTTVINICGDIIYILSVGFVLCSRFVYLSVLRHVLFGLLLNTLPGVSIQSNSVVVVVCEHGESPAFRQRHGKKWRDS